MGLIPFQISEEKLNEIMEETGLEFKKCYSSGNVIIRVQPSNDTFAVIMDSGTIMIGDDFLWKYF